MTKIFNQQSQLDLRRKLRSNLVKSERVLWGYIWNQRMDFKFKRQFGIGRYIVDFYCSQIKLVVEIDGMTHNDEKIYNNDIKRQNYLESLGLIVKRYTSVDVLFNLKVVLDDLYYICNELADKK